MPAFDQHIFVCGNHRSCDHPRGCCDPQGTNSLRNSLKAAIKARQLGSLVRVNSAGCLDQCELGPTIVIYPQGTWYGNVQQTDIPRIVDSIADGSLIDDLLIPDELLNTKGQGPAAPGQSGLQS